MIDSLYSLVQKTGFTDPLHAPITHIPIGLVIGAFLFFLVAIIFGKKNLLSTARHVSILAFLFVFPTILFGVFDWLHFFKGAFIQPPYDILNGCVEGQLNQLDPILDG